MSKRPARRHWLHENASVRSPYRVLVVDTETRVADPQHPEHQTLRLWCARLVRRQGVDPEQPRTEDYRGDTAGELARLVHELARRDRTLWLYAHNLGFDLAVTALPVELAARGWRLTEGALTSDSPWCRMARSGCRVTMADTWSWLPASLQEIGTLMGGEKLALPANDDPDEDWYARCARDVELTADAVVALMDWWDANELGVWSVTGPACGWSTYRHQRPAPRVLVDPDPDARAMEARAVTGGRRDVRRVGQLPPGLYVDLDVATAHLTVMGNLPLPAQRMHAFEGMDPDDSRLRSRVVDVLADVELDVRTPRYPWDSGRGVFYPTGRFRTTLAGPEIREAHARGELVSIGAGHVYHVRAHMQPWAVWLAGLIDRERTDVPAVVRLLAKHWSRCVPGKWASHTSEVVDKVPDPRPGWAVERGAIMPGMRAADFLRVGGELWTIARDEWADDAFPAILAYIQSHTRLALGRLLDALGDSWVSCNTDGTMVDALRWWDLQHPDHRGRRPRQAEIVAELDAWCHEQGRRWAPFTIRPKGAWRDLTVLGPQHLILSGERRLAGIPSRAVDLGDGAFRFTAWPKLRVQLVPDAPTGYRTEDRTVNLAHVAPNGWLLESGRVAPIDLWTNTLPDRPAPATVPVFPVSATLAPRDRQHAALRPFWPAEVLGL